MEKIKKDTAHTLLRLELVFSLAMKDQINSAINAGKILIALILKQVILQEKDSFIA